MHLFLDDGLLGGGGALRGVLARPGVQALLQDGQRELLADHCARVVAGHVDERALQVRQHRAAVLQAPLHRAQLLLDPVEEGAVVVHAVQLPAHILRMRPNFVSDTPHCMAKMRQQP